MKNSIKFALAFMIGMIVVPVQSMQLATQFWNRASGKVQGAIIIGSAVTVAAGFYAWYQNRRATQKECVRPEVANRGAVEQIAPEISPAIAQDEFPAPTWQMAHHSEEDQKRVAAQHDPVLARINDLRGHTIISPQPIANLRNAHTKLKALALAHPDNAEIPGLQDSVEATVEDGFGEIVRCLHSVAPFQTKTQTLLWLIEGLEKKLNH